MGIVSCILFFIFFFCLFFMDDIKEIFKICQKSKKCQHKNCQCDEKDKEEK